MSVRTLTAAIASAYMAGAVTTAYALYRRLTAWRRLLSVPPIPTGWEGSE